MRVIEMKFSLKLSFSLHTFMEFQKGFRLSPPSIPLGRPNNTTLSVALFDFTSGSAREPSPAIAISSRWGISGFPQDISIVNKPQSH